MRPRTDSGVRVCRWGQGYASVKVMTGCLAFIIIGISRPYFAITNKTRVQGSKIRNKFKN